MKSNIMIIGKVIDKRTGNKLHETTSDDFDDFDELFTKPMRRKLS